MTSQEDVPRCPVCREPMEEAGRTALRYPDHPERGEVVFDYFCCPLHGSVTSRPVPRNGAAPVSRPRSRFVEPVL